jgi:hypothetical protein
MHAWLLFVIVIAGGFFGGIVDLFHKISYRSGRFSLYGEISPTYDELLLPSTFWLLVSRSGIIGVGGALALCAIRIYADEFKNHLEELPIHVLYNFSLSVIAGFAARTLLPNIARSLERKFQERLEEQDKKIDEKEVQHHEQIEQARISLEAKNQDVAKQLKRSEVMLLATAALEGVAVKSDVQIAIAELQKLLMDNPIDRRVAIYLGRLLAREERLDDAVKTLDDFIAHGPPPNPDVADALYNKACYLMRKAARLAEKGAASKATEAIYKEAYASLQGSVTLLPANAVDALGDQDFETARNSEEFQRILKTSSPTT